MIISKIGSWIPATISTTAFWWWSSQVIRAYDYRFFVIATTVVTVVMLLIFFKNKCSSVFRCISFGIAACYMIGLVVNTTISFFVADGGWPSAFSKVISSWQYLVVILGIPILLGTLFHGALLALSVWLFFRNRTAPNEI